MTDKQSSGFLIWRMPMFVFTASILIWGLIKSGVDYMAYLTFWGFALITFYFLLGMLSTIWKLNNSLTILMQELSTSFAFLITAGYWIFGSTNPVTMPMFSFFNIAFHILNSVIMLFDTIITRYVYIPKHLLFILGFGLLYAIFNLIYVKIVGHSIYNLISWNNIQTLGWLVACAVALIAAFILAALISFIARRIIPVKNTQNVC